MAKSSTAEPGLFPSPDVRQPWHFLCGTFRDYLKSHTLPGGICIAANNEHPGLCVESGAPRDYFIDHSLVRNLIMREGKSYCVVHLDDILCIKEPGFHRTIYELIEQSGLHQKEPFMHNNILYELITISAEKGEAQLKDYLIRLQPENPGDLVSLAKVIWHTTGETERVLQYITTVFEEPAEIMRQDTFMELLKITRWLLGEEKTAEKLYKLHTEMIGHQTNSIFYAALRRYILGHASSHDEIIHQAFAGYHDISTLLLDVHSLAHHFDMQLAKKLLDKWAGGAAEVSELLNIAYLYRLFFDDEAKCTVYMEQARSKITNFADAVLTLQSSYRLGYKVKEAAGLVRQFMPEDLRDVSQIAPLMILYRYFFQDTRSYEQMMMDLMMGDYVAADLLMIAEELMEFNGYAHDPERLYIYAEEQAADSQDFTQLVRWILHFKPEDSAKIEGYLTAAEELAGSYDELMLLADLFLETDNEQKATAMLEKASGYISSCEEALESAGRWFVWGKKKKIREMLLKAESLAETAVDFRETAMEWLSLCNDGESSERCVTRAIELGWQEHSLS